MELERQKMRSWDVGKVGKDKDNDKEETTTLLSASPLPTLSSSRELLSASKKEGSMKKIVFVLVAVLACSFAVAACSKEKKSKRLNTVTVMVTPSSIGQITSSAPVTLTAEVRINNAVQTGAEVIWSVEPQNFGVFSSTKGASTDFTADLAKTGNGIIFADYNGTKSSVTFSINAATIDSVAIFPSAPQTMFSSHTLTFTATAMAGTTAVTDAGTQISWTAAGGNISPNPSNSGASVTFTPSAGSTNATVKASYGTIESSVVNIDISTGIAAGDTKRFLFKDNLMDPNVNWSYNTWGDWQWYPSGYVDSRTPQYPTTSDFIIEGESEGIQGVSVIDPLVALKLTFKKGSWTGDHYAGMTFDFIANENLTEYTKICFYAKGENGGEKILIEPGGINTEVITLNPTWTPYERSFTGTVSQKTVLNVFFRESDGSVDNSSVYVDYIYLDK